MTITAPVDAQTLARLADRFELRVATLAENIDESWRVTGADSSVWLERPGNLGDMAERKRQLSRFYLRCCGGWPSLLDLAQPASRLSLLEREPLHRRLCALALLARPGAVRSCVERNVREALAASLGPAYARLREMSVVGVPLPADAAAWSPLEWACVGYADLAHVDAWPHKSLRQMVRLTLPQRWTIDRSRKYHPRAQLPASQALERLDALFEGAS